MSKPIYTADKVRWAQCSIVYVPDHDKIAEYRKTALKIDPDSGKVYRKDGEDIILFEFAVPMFDVFASRKEAARELERRYRRHVEQKHAELITAQSRHREILRMATGRPAPRRRLHDGL